MANHDRCPKCGALVLPTERFCAQCGATLEGDAATGTTPTPATPEAKVNAREEESGWIEATPRAKVNALTNADSREEALPKAVTAAPAKAAAQAEAAQSSPPRTIEALKAFCARNEMPLEKMRFFIDVDYREPKAFGIYRDQDSFVVYKNKADGSRAVRYQGPDEGWAVKELYEKLLDECHDRGIYPDAPPKERAALRKARRESQKKAERRRKRLIIVVAILTVIVGVWVFVTGLREHRFDGYYTFDDGYYYRYGDNWYYDDGYADWVLLSSFPYAYDTYDDYYLGEDYEDDWGIDDFKESDVWESIQAESHTHSDDYSSWDSGGTDWSSDW